MDQASGSGDNAQTCDAVPGLQLNDAEKLLLREVPRGSAISFCSRSRTESDSDKVGPYSKESVIRSAVVERLVCEPLASERISFRGLRVKGAQITGALNLQNASVPFPLEFTDCKFDDEIILSGASVKSVNLRGSCVKGVIAENTQFDGDVLLGNGFKSEGAVVIDGAAIRGNLDCSDGLFAGQETVALSANDIEVKRSILLEEGFRSKGDVCLARADIRGDLSCSGGRFACGDETALLVEDARIGGSVFLDEGFSVEGRVDLSRIIIQDSLVCTGGTFVAHDEYALSASGADVGGDVWLADGFRAEGDVQLIGMRIGGNFFCSNGQFNVRDKYALLASSMTIKGFVSLEGLRATGPISFSLSKIDGFLDCSRGEFVNPGDFALHATDGRILGGVVLGEGFRAEGSVSFSGATIRGGLSCHGSVFGDLTTVHTVISRGVFLFESFQAEGHVQLDGASITGPLICAGLIRNTEGTALSFTAAKIENDVRLSGKLEGLTACDLSDATIDSELDCTNGEFIGLDGAALCARNARIAGDVHLGKGFRSRSVVELCGATVGGGLFCSDGQFRSPGGVALDGDNIDVAGNVFLTEGFKAEGEVRMCSARIAGGLYFQDAVLDNLGGCALLAAEVSVRGSLSLENVRAVGAVVLLGANVGGSILCSGGQFENRDAAAFDAKDMQVGNDVVLSSGFVAKGVTRLAGAGIGGSLKCSGATFSNLHQMTLQAENIQVKGDVLLDDNFRAEGFVNLSSASIGGMLSCAEGAFINPEARTLDVCDTRVGDSVLLCDGFTAVGKVSLVSTTIQGALVWERTRKPDQAVVDLRGASVRQLWDDAGSWPAKGGLLLHGLKYAEIGDRASIKAGERVRWLRLQPSSSFSLQPYEQLSAVLRQMGHANAARRVQIAKNTDRRRRGDMSSWQKPAHLVLGLLTGYGYQPWRTLVVGLVLVLVGWGLFHAASRADMMEYVGAQIPTSASPDVTTYTTPDLYPLLYSIDVFLPVIEFGHARQWNAVAGAAGSFLGVVRITGLFLSCYEWFLTMAGWVLTTLFVAAISGVIDRRAGSCS